MGVFLDTAEEQRFAAEEYIAHLAQKGVPKPSWWKEFLQKIRMWWSNTRFGSELHMTDAQIETLLARAARKVRNRAVVKENLTTETDGYGKVRSGTEEVRFAVDGIEGQKTATAVTVPDLPVDMKNTAAVRQYLYEQFKGREVQIKSDGRWTFFNRQGLEDTLKRRGEHRNSFPSLDNAVEESYPVGYETVDQRHGEKRKDLKGQFIYAALVDIHGEQYIATIKLDDTAADKRAYFKDISIKKRSLYVGQPQTVVDPSADRSITIQQLIDYVKGDFAQSEIFSEKMPVVPDYNGMRFSLADYDEQTQDDIIAILRPFVRQNIDMEPERYIAYLKEKNVNIPDEDAAVFFRLAVIENDKAARERIKRARGNKESDKSCKQYLASRKEKGVWGAV